jgi:hypothetical protein
MIVRRPNITKLFKYQHNDTESVDQTKLYDYGTINL